MLIYLDASCFNRPFDDRSQIRVREETEAVVRVLQRILEGEDQLVWSTAMTFELSAHPEWEIRSQLLDWRTRSFKTVTLTRSIRGRTEELVSSGLKPLDGAHLAFAEDAQCSVLLTCDDQFLRRARRVKASVRVLNPIEYVQEMRNG